MTKPTILSHFQRGSFAVFLLFLFLCGCGTTAEFYGKSYSHGELYPPHAAVVPPDMILRGDTEDEIVKRILGTLPQESANVYLTRCYMPGIDGIIYSEFLRKFGVPGAPFYAFRFSEPLSPEAEKAFIQIFTPVTKYILGVSEDDARSLSKNQHKPGGMLERLMDRNTVMALNPAERTRSYISTLSDREWDP